MRWSRVESGPGSALTHPLVRLAIAGGEDETMELILASGREQEAHGSVSTLRILWPARANPTARGGCSGGQRPALFAGRRHARTIEHRRDGDASHVHIHRCRRGAKGGVRSPQLRTEAKPMLTPMEERQRALVHRLVFRSDLVNSVWGRRTRTDAGVGAVHFGVRADPAGSGRRTFQRRNRQRQLSRVGSKPIAAGPRIIAGALESSTSAYPAARCRTDHAQRRRAA